MFSSGDGVYELGEAVSGGKVGAAVHIIRDHLDKLFV